MPQHYLPPIRAHSRAVPADLRVPADALGDSFGAGTTVELPFAAWAGIWITF